jgi:thioredoxin 1
MDPACDVPRVSEADFEQSVLQAVGPVFVHVAEQPCRSCPSAALLSRSAGWCGARARWYCVDGRSCPALAARYGVTDLPTLLLFREGKVVRRLVGAPLPDCLDTFLRVGAAGARP